MGIPATTNVHHLIQLWDDVVTRRTPGSAVYVVIHPGKWTVAARTVLGFRDWLVDPDRDALVPHAVIDDDEVAGLGSDRELLDLIATRLEQTMPPGAGSLRLDSYWLLRRALDVPRSAGSTRSQRRRTRNHLFDEVLAGRPVLGWLAGLSDHDSSSLWQRMVSSAAKPILRFGYGIWLSNAWSYSWVSSQLTEPLRLSRTDLLGNCVLLAGDGAEVANRTLVHQLLVEALLRDIDAASARRPLSVRHRRRRWRPVVLLGDLDGPERPVGRLCQALVEHAADASPPLVVLVAAERPPDYARVAVGAGAGFRHPVRVSAEPAVLLVELSADEDDLEAARAMELRPKVDVPLPSRWDWLSAVATALVVLAAIVGMGWAVRAGFAALTDDCWTKEIDGEEVGIGDGTCTELATDPETRELLGRMAENNRNARDQAEADGDHIQLRTIVYLAPLGRSTPDDGVLQQLRGAVAAQEEVNERDGSTRLQLLVADPGEDYVAQQPVIAELVRRITGDELEGFVGVVGVSKTWGKTRAAVKTLIAQDVPVIGASITGSVMTDLGGTYYQVSPANADLAATIAGELASTDERLVLVYNPDEDDLFSSDLRDQLVEAVDDGGRFEEDDIKYRAGTIDRGSGPAAEKLCRVLDGAEAGDMAVLYAGRQADLGQLLLATTSKLGCDELAPGAVRLFTTAEPPDPPAGQAWRFEIVTASYGDVGDRTDPEGGLSLGTILADTFQHEGWEPPDADAAQGFDAVEFLNLVVEGEGPGPTTFRNVAADLTRGTTGLPGASGTITLGGEQHSPPTGEDGMEISVEVSAG